MVNTDDSAGCTVCVGQRGRSEQGVRIKQILEEHWRKGEWLRADLHSENTTTGCKNLGRKNTDRQLQYEGEGAKKKMCFVSKGRRIVF